MADDEQVANPGSTLGEAVGATMEREVNRLLHPLAAENGCVFLSAGKPDPRTGAATTLYLEDEFKTRYKVDSVIANVRIQPLVLVESKYIRYTKHNRDKGSWIANTHSNLRRAYPTVRQSLAILAGSWSAPAKAMIQSADTVVFDVGFERVADTLAQYGIDFRWGDKERGKAHEAWSVWQSLTDADYDAIGYAFLSDIEPDLRELLRVALEDEGRAQPPKPDACPACGAPTDENGDFLYFLPQRMAQ